MKKRNNDNFYSNSIVDAFLSGNGIAFMHQIMAEGERAQRQEAKAKFMDLYGFEKNEAGLIGSTKLNIPQKYFDLEVNHNIIKMYHPEEVKIDAYDFSGKLLFSGMSITHIGKNWFLVETEEQPENMSYKLRKLMNTEGFVSEHYYHANSSTTFEGNEFCQLSCVEIKDGPRKYKTVVVNSEGKEVFMNDGMLDYLNITGCLVSSNKGYTNLLTGELVAEKYTSNLKSKNFLFLGASYGRDAVLKINIHTGEVEKFD